MKNVLCLVWAVPLTAIIALAFAAYPAPDPSSGPPSKITTSSGIQMVRVADGTFELGRELGTAGSGDTTPVSTVTVTGFYLGKYPVTQAQYQAVMGSNPSAFSSNPASGETQGRRSVECVSWYDALVWGSTKIGNCTKPRKAHVSLYVVRN